VGGRQQLLGEERVALGPGEDAVDQAGRRRAAEDRRHLRGRLRPPEPGDLHAPGPGAAELGQERPQPWAARLVAAVGDQQDDPLAAEVAGQVGQQVAGRAVGPVHVLDHQHQHGLLGQGSEQAEHELEQPDLVGRLGRCAGGVVAVGVAEGRQQAGQLRPGRPGQRPDRLHPDLGHQVPEGLDRRGEGQAAVGDRHAAADQDPIAVPDPPGGELGDQACLADAGLAPHQEDRRRAAVRLLQRLVERCQLARPTDEGGAGHLPAHLAGIIAPVPLDGNRVSTGSGPKERELRATRIGRSPDSGHPVPAASSGRHKTSRHDEVDEMQQQLLPTVGPTARRIALSLLVAVFLVVALALALLATRPAPDPPDPKPPMQFGPSAGHARPM
jgi:hypothetical protein